MGLRVIHDRDEGRAVVYNSTYESAFSPVFMDRDGLDAGEVAEMFIEFINDSGVSRKPGWENVAYAAFFHKFSALLKAKREREAEHAD